ncbi:unnamed protein product [Chondrus crispus]|uniref:Uncharacterized protein n=1 Tax=Chondrus crispus TaxID=2769 RepID=R7Q6J8_CHOCR|nr:unnamed protein product [Chondrus crispus]CDF33458.1 unnamed protein product [Chondrus crispus]|eukprot:XP_005713261.1 unnamed protein product [Chondrus crispus]
MWTSAEHDRMLEGLRLFKRDWAKVTSFVGTRSAAQVRSHAQKYFDRVARDKTDDYVPRARPKRKSATPYPRKARDHPSAPRSAHHQPTHLSHPTQLPHPANPTHHPMSVPVQSIAMPPHPQTISHPHHIQHPFVPLHLANQSPLIQQLPVNSPCLSQPSPSNIPLQQAIPQHVYSPYVFYPSPSSGQDPAHMRPSPVPQPSPASFLGSPYTRHSPAPHIQATATNQQVFNMFSPLTPASFASTVTQLSAMNHLQMALVAAPHVQPRPVSQQHFPTHSHPGGPMENCTKCAALQRYGNVLQEIGEIRQPQMTSHTPNDENPRFPSLRADLAMPVSCSGQKSQKSKRQLSNDETKESTRQPSSFHHGSAISSDITGSPGSSPAAECLDQNEAAARGAAGHRASRAKVMKERKARAMVSGMRPKSPSPVQGEESNESFNSSHTRREGEVSRRNKGDRSTRADSVKSKDSQKRQSKIRSIPQNSTTKRRSSGSAESRPAKRPKSRDQSADSGKQMTSEDMSSTRPDMNRKTARRSERTSTPRTGQAGDANEGSNSKSNSSGGKVYSPSERKAIFDAVKSLQILAKTSSSSPEPN